MKYSTVPNEILVKIVEYVILSPDPHLFKLDKKFFNYTRVCRRWAHVFIYVLSEHFIVSYCCNRIFAQYKKHFFREYCYQSNFNALFGENYLYWLLYNGLRSLGLVVINGHHNVISLSTYTQPEIITRLCSRPFIYGNSLYHFLRIFSDVNYDIPWNHWKHSKDFLCDVLDVDYPLSSGVLSNTLTLKLNEKTAIIEKHYLKLLGRSDGEIFDGILSINARSLCFRMDGNARIALNYLTDAINPIRSIPLYFERHCTTKELLFILDMRRVTGFIEEMHYETKFAWKRLAVRMVRACPNLTQFTMLFILSNLFYNYEFVEEMHAFSDWADNVLIPELCDITNVTFQFLVPYNLSSESVKRFSARKGYTMTKYTGSNNKRVIMAGCNYRHILYAFSMDF